METAATSVQHLLASSDQMCTNRKLVQEIKLICPRVDVRCTKYQLIT